MKVLPALLLALPIASTAAEPFDYAKQLRDNGNITCSPAVNAVTNWLLDQQGGTVSLWNKADAENRMAFLLGSRKYSDGSSVMNLSAARTPNNGCDVSFSLLLLTPQSCTSIRESTLKEWKFYGEVGGLPVYDDPTTGNVQAVLQPNGAGCAITKSGVLFYDAAGLTALQKQPGAPP